MRPDFWFGVAVVVCGLSMMTYGAWPRRETPEVKTLAIWTNDKGIAAMAWYDDLLTKEQIDSRGSYINAKLEHTIVIQGHPLGAR